MVLTAVNNVKLAQPGPGPQRETAPSNCTFLTASHESRSVRNFTVVRCCVVSKTTSTLQTSLTASDALHGPQRTLLEEPLSGNRAQPISNYRRED